MIIHKHLKLFLEIIYIENLDFKNITETNLREHFRINEYYNLKEFCINNEIILIEYHKVNLTKLGIDLFNILKKLKNI